MRRKGAHRWSFLFSEAGGNEEERCAPFERFLLRKPEDMRRKGAHRWSFLLRKPEEMRRKGCALLELFASEAGGNEEERSAPLERFCFGSRKK